MHRTQWTGIDGAPVTQVLSGNAFFKNKRMGAGFSLVNDKIGVHQNFTAMGSYAYQISVGPSAKISFGLQAGVRNRKSDYASLAPDSGNDPMVAVSAFSQTSFDAGAGVYLRTGRFHLGLSAPQLLPEKSTVNDSMTVHWDRTTYFLFSKYRITVTEILEVEPNVLVKYFPGTPLSVDLNLNFIFYKAITFGCSYRKDESVDFLFLGKITPQFQFGYAYDFPIGDVPKTVSGSHEIMLNYRFQFHYTKVDSPR